MNSRKMRSRFQNEPPIEFSTEPKGGRTGLTLFGSIIIGALILAMGGLAVWWIMSDYSGEYDSKNDNLGYVRLDLVRRAASVEGTISIGNTQNLEIIEGHVGNDNQIELSFAPKTEGDQRPITASFKGMIDPARVESNSVNLNFNQVLNPYTAETKQPQGVSMSMPRVDVEGKIIKGVLTFNGLGYELSLRRDPLTSMFRQLKSHWPGAS